MNISDPAAAAVFLSKVSYYRASGYFRYWQVDPTNKDQRFRRGSSFERIAKLYADEQALCAYCFGVIHGIEVLLRTRFAYSYAQCIGPIGKFAHGEGFTQAPGNSRERVEEYVLADLDRSKETFIAHYRRDRNSSGYFDPEAYADMPIWVAVEAFSFGTLSCFITASKKSGVLDDLADSLNVSRTHLPSQVLSFVYLRNRISHNARLWNHSVLDKPGIARNLTRRITKKHRRFDDNSVYKILLALDDIAQKNQITENFLADYIEPLLIKNPLLAGGIATPRKYGEMPENILAG